MRIVFMGTPEFSVPSLEGLIASGYEIMGVYTQPDRQAGRGKGVVQSPVKQVALRHNLPIFQPESLRDPAEVERLRQLAPDAIVVAAFGQFLPRAVLNIPPYKCLNVHPSLLPKYRGPSPVTYAILSGDQETGVTIMILTPKMDAGPILAQRREKIEPDDTTGTLLVKLARVGADLLVETLPKWFRGEIAPQPQNEDEVTFTRMVYKEDGFLDWNLSAVELWLRVRAFQPWPGTYTKWRGKILKVVEAAPVGGGQERPPGTVVKLDLAQTGVAIGVQTSDGLLGFKKVQMEGRKVTSGDEFLRGYRDILGETLPS